MTACLRDGDFVRAKIGGSFDAMPGNPFAFDARERRSLPRQRGVLRSLEDRGLPGVYSVDTTWSGSCTDRGDMADILHNWERDNPAPIERDGCEERMI